MCRMPFEIPNRHLLFKVNIWNTRNMCKICSKFTINTPERRRSGIFIVSFEQISEIVLMFPLLTLNK